MINALLENIAPLEAAFGRQEREERAKLAATEGKHTLIAL